VLVNKKYPQKEPPSRRSKTVVKNTPKELAIDTAGSSNALYVTGKAFLSRFSCHVVASEWLFSFH
jgi:hypothetical protein